MIFSFTPRGLLVLAFLLGACCLFSQAPNAGLAQSVSLRRTAYGVPHIHAPTLKGAAFGLAYCELEDYGAQVLRPLIAARGELALVDGWEAVEQDLARKLSHQRAVATYAQLDADTRAMYDGFAAGVNFYLDTHPDSLGTYQAWRFAGFDIAAVHVEVAVPTRGAGFIEAWKRRQALRDSLAMTGAGSNAWALAPSRTREGHAFLLRNPHLSWSAGYYEAHLTVPGKLNFYGDFRIGGLFAIIGGFSDRLGFATTNNYPDLEEVYALKADTLRADHVILDGVSIPLERKRVEAAFRHGKATGYESREWLFSPFGPVIHREGGQVFVLRRSGDGEYRRGQQFLRMMRAANLEGWKAAMRMQAITASNYTYADADGHIFYVWNAATPDFPHPSGGDTAAVEVSRSDQVWSAYIPFDSLPQLQDPPGGYLHNENDPFHFANLQQVLAAENYPPHFPQPRLGARSQHSLELIANERVFSLEDLVVAKHSLRMRVADQMKEDLLKILSASRPDREMRRAIRHLQTWDNRVAADSRGGVLFAEWFTLYTERLGEKEGYRIPWDPARPMTTPEGIAQPDSALRAMERAMDRLEEQFGTWDLAWGEVHRIRHGRYDLPASGGPGGLGCFRVLWYRDGKDGKREVRGGDGWQLAVSFSEPPRAYSILAYGQSPRPGTAHHDDQVEMFARQEMKPVAFTEAEIARQLIRAYHPGE